MATSILGISGLYHDSAAAIVVDGRIVAAAQEERFTRIKHDANFPQNAVAYCLREAGLTPREVNHVVFYEKPYLKFQRLLDTYVQTAPAGFRSFFKAMPVWLHEKLHTTRELRKALGGEHRGRFIFTEHHESHAASAFFPSPFERAAILTIDGVGEWATTTFGTGEGNRISLSHELHFPDSLGLLYSAFTYFCGFRVNSGEYKLMGLAPYGTPVYESVILKELLELRDDGSFRLNQKYFDYRGGLRMTSRVFAQLFGGPPREPESPLTQREFDLAASIQVVTERIVLRLAQQVHRLTGLSDLCLAGGVALNCVANGRLAREGPFKRIWVQPAAGDAGGALGAALFVHYQLLGRKRTPQAIDAQAGSLLGPSFTNDEMVQQLTAAGAVFKKCETHADLCRDVARLIAARKVVGWVQGRMEFGPRSLGNRSILGDPRDPAAQRTINVAIKFRESFRPFAPAVLAERAAEFFDLHPLETSPYMLFVAPVAKAKRVEDTTRLSGLARVNEVRSVIPAVTHVDYSARIQTVDRETNPLFHELIAAFERETGCPVLVNTSFNVRGEPIVCTPSDAYRCFMATQMDALAVGPYLMLKSEQPVVPGAQRYFESLAKDS